MQVEVVTKLSSDRASALAALHRGSAAVDGVDPFSVVSPLPTADGLQRQAQDAEKFLLAVLPDGMPVAWAALHSWFEDDLSVFLVDGFVDQAVRGRGLATDLLHRLEQPADDGSRPADNSRAVLAGNSGAHQPERRKLLVDNGYQYTFSIVAMRLVAASDLCPVEPAMDGITVRTATVADADAVHALTQLVWACREFVDLPSVESIRAWLMRSDLGLFQLALDGSVIVGFVASTSQQGRPAEIDDVQVHPAHQRRGIASMLLHRNLSALATRGNLEVRLQTEGHDPAGALSLYRRLGFSTIGEYQRFRKPVGSGSTRR